MDFLLQLSGNSAFIRTLLIIGCIVAFLITSRVFSRFMSEFANRHQFGELRVRYIIRLANLGFLFLGISVVALLLGLGYSEISVFLSSIFAVVGVALFAQWSILSNITASMIIFFSFPYRVGDRIKILDKDDDISGVIRDITAFHVIIRRDDGNKITYPNTLILQKAVLKIERPLAKTVTEQEA